MWVDFADESIRVAEAVLQTILREPVDLASPALGPSPRFMKEYTQVVFPLPVADSSGRPQSLHLLLSSRLLATVRAEGNVALSVIDQTLKTLANLASRVSVDLDVAFCRLLDELIDGNEASLETARESAEKIERSAMTVESHEVVQDVSRTTVELNTLHDLLQKQRILLLDLLEGLLPGVGVSRLARSLLLDARHKVERQLDLTDRYDHELSGVISLTDLALTLRLNRVMTLLTVIATVLLLPNTVGTILGIPSLPIPYGAWDVIAFILLVSGLLPTWYAYRKGWLKP